MSDPTPLTAKQDPETLVLRANPKPVMRFKRPVLIGAAALGCVTIFGITWMGLGTPVPKAAETGEVFDPDATADRTNGKPQSLETLPTTYADVPQLGPPLPGDLGGAVMVQQQGIETIPAQGDRSLSATSAPDDRSGIFFQMSSPGQASPPVANGPPNDPFTISLSGATPQTMRASEPQSGGSRQTGSIYNSHQIETPASPYQVMAGTVITANLVTGLKSDISGLVIAQVSAPVFDTVTGRILLIPQGTKLLGAYENDLTFGQSRLLLIWKRMILPDGSSLEIDNFPAADTQGYAGLSDKVDYHTWSLLKGVGLSTLLGLTAYDGQSDDSDLVRAFHEATRTTGNQAGQELVRRSVDIKPTVTVRPGWPVRVIVQKDLILRPYSEGATPWQN